MLSLRDTHFKNKGTEESKANEGEKIDPAFPNYRGKKPSVYFAKVNVKKWYQRQRGAFGNDKRVEKSKWSYLDIGVCQLSITVTSILEE